jgi:glycerol-3-phosphate dehydrogenase
VAPDAANFLAPLTRDTDRAKAIHHDVIIIGGGIHGACLLYEASKRGLRALLVEKDDFGGAASWNSMRILHGGFRYLQSMDISRFMDSVRERRWFMRMFPGLIEPIRCVMPLYGEGMKRPSAFRAALKVNNQLSRFEGRRPQELKLEPGRVLTASDVAQDWPQVPTTGLKGGGMWTDARMCCPERIIIHLLRVADSMGSGSLNYCSAERIETVGESVIGVRCRDTISQEEMVFHAPLVLNAAGSWCRDIAEQFANDRPELFTPMRAFNIILDRKPVSDSALAISDRAGGTPAYFLVPMGERLVAGTAQVPCSAEDFSAIPLKEEIENFLNELNKAAPGLGATLDQVSCVWHGQVSATFAGSTVATDRPVVVDHTEFGGPSGLISVSGVKYTTARRLAQRVVAMLPGPPVAPLQDVPSEERVAEIPGYGGGSTVSPDVRVLEQIMRNESVVHAEDLVFRRTGLWQNPKLAVELMPLISKALGLSPELAEAQEARLRQCLVGLSKPWEKAG